MKNIYRNKTILITGAGGTLGSVIIEKLLKFKPKSIRALGHSERPLYEIVEKFNHNPRVRPILRDITDRDGMKMAIEGSDIVIHCAAVKSIDIAHYNALHAVQTNINGTMNIINHVLNSPTVERMIFISSDKAVYPVSLYGATKLVSEYMMEWAQNISKKKVFCCTRSGNFYGSLMSVIPLWHKQAKEGKPITITDPKMLRYFIKTEDMAEFILKVLSNAKGGEIFIPGSKIMKEYKMIDIANKISKKHKIVGARPGERLREPLWTDEEEDEIRKSDDYYVLKN